MVYEVVWTLNAVNSYGDNITYLQEEWTERETARFIAAAERKINAISAQPYIGTSGSRKEQNIRFTIINKRIALIYRVKPRSKKIELLLFWNTHRHPRRMSPTLKK